MRREEQGLGPWDVLFCSQGTFFERKPFYFLFINTFPLDLRSAELTSAAHVPQFTASRDVKCQATRIADVRIPVPPFTGQPDNDDDDDDGLEDWNADMAALFEWVGMACLGSQR